MSVSSQPPSIQELKRALVQAGLEIYRTRPDAVHLAERPRDNQILDAGISVRPAGSDGTLEVRVVLRAQRSDFPNDTKEVAWDRVRATAQHELLASGHSYAEHEARELPMLDPGDKSKTLDVWYEIVFSTVLPDVEAAIAEVRRVLVVDKYVKVT